MASLLQHQSMSMGDFQPYKYNIYKYKYNFKFNSLQKLDTLGLKVPCKHSNEIYCTKSCSIISFTLSVNVLRGVSLQMVGILRFVRRWLVIGRVIRQVFPQICGVVFLLLLLLLLFSHTGIMVQMFFFLLTCIFSLMFCT